MDVIVRSSSGQGGCSGFILHTRMTRVATQGKIPVHTALISPLGVALL